MTSMFGRLPPTTSLTSLRSVAADRWAVATAEMRTIDPQVPEAIPGYFVDRYALGSHRAMGTRRAPKGPSHSQTPDSRSDYLSSCVKPTAALHGWTPWPLDIVEPSPFYYHLVAQWHAFIVDSGGPTGLATLPDVAGAQWAAVLNNSVFYPGPPVFRGATYLDALSVDARQRVLSQYGSLAAVDFFTFMLQVHETVHFHQVGEPLLNEYVQACLWTAFLDSSQMWIFQEDSSPALSLVRELGLVRSHQWAEAAFACGLDAAALMDVTAAEGTYFVCCLAGYCFDFGGYSYASYLSLLKNIFDHRDSESHIRAIFRELSSIADHVGRITD